MAPVVTLVHLTTLQANGVKVSTSTKVPYFKKWPSSSPKIIRRVRLLEDITLLCTFFFSCLPACLQTLCTAAEGCTTKGMRAGKQYCSI